MAYLPVLVIPAILFAWLSIAREHLVPHDADYERATWLLTGDEPAYLLAAQAIASGDGQNLRNVNNAMTYTNFQMRPIIGNTQWTWDYHANIPAFKYWINRRSAWDQRQTLHRPPLLPALLAPLAFSAHGVRWKACVLQGVLVALGVALVLYTYSPNHAAGRWLSGVAAFLVIGSLPAAYYTSQIYAETLTGIILLVALVLLTTKQRVSHWIAYSLLIASLWGTARVGLGVVAVLTILLLRCVQRKHFLDVIYIILGIAAYIGHNLIVWGYPIPPNPDTSSPLTIAFIPKGLLINFFSNAVGLFFLSPVLFTAMTSLVLLVIFRPGDSETWLTVALFGGCLVTTAAFPAYRAGTCPAGRYQVIQAYLLLFPLLQCIALIDDRWRRRLLVSLFILGLPSLLISGFVMIYPRCWFEGYIPVFRYQSINHYFDLLPNVHKGAWWPQLPVWILVFLFTLVCADIPKILMRIATVCCHSHRPS